MQNFGWGPLDNAVGRVEAYARSHAPQMPWLGAGLAFLWLAAGMALGPHYDYTPYMVQWARIMAGYDPWLGDPTNAYGPGHVLLAPLFQLHRLLPKLLFLLSWIGAFLVVFVAAGRDVVIGAFSFLVLFLTPFFFILVNIYGVEDTLVASLTLVAVDLRVRKGWSLLPAILLTIAGFTKIYPLVLLPYLATDRGIIDWRFVFCVLFISAVAALLTYIGWGSSVLYIFEFASGRGSVMISIFNFLSKSDLSPLSAAQANFLLVWNTVIVIVVLAGFYALQYLAKMTALVGTTIAIIAMLAFYKVGNPQYCVCSGVLLVYFLAVEASKRRDLDRKLLLAAGGYFFMLNLFQALFIFIKNYPPVSGFIGLPIFIASVILLWQLVRYALSPLAARNGAAAMPLSGARGP
jgi:hypothetical protein